MFKEFKDFIMTGNVIDLAVAVILAAAIGLVINGFVSDIMMPFVGHFTGGMDFADLAYELSPAVMENGEVVKAANTINYGKWFNSVIGLITTGFVLFMMVKSYNKTKTPPTPPAPAGPAGPSQEDLLAEIRDLLKKQ